jgi:protein ImuB
LERLVAWGEAFSPLVGLDQEPTPAGLLLDITGIAARHGGERPLAEQIQRQLHQQGYWSQLGLADTLGAAWALAHTARSTEPVGPSEPVGPTRPAGPARATGGEIHIAPPGESWQALAPLPVAALRLSDTALAWLAELGLERIAQLADLPRAGISSRLGAEVLQRLDQALGRVPEIFLAYQSQQPCVARWQAEHPTARYEVLRQVVEHLSHHLAEQLASQQQGALQLRCRLHCEPRHRQASSDDPCAEGKFAAIEWDVSLFRPTPQADYLWQLLQTQLEQRHLPGPVVAVELSAVATAPLRQHQPQLWDSDALGAAAEPLAHLIDRLSNRLGPQAVCAARLRAGVLPETAYALIPLAGSQSSRAGLHAGLDRTPPAADHRPLRLLHPPRPLHTISLTPQGEPLRFVASGAAEQVVHAWGPERIETSWWQGPSVRRDYYRVHCASGARWWLFRNLDDQHWFLHGEFA